MSVFRLFVVALIFALGGTGCSCARPPVQNTLKPDGDACAKDEECESSLCDKLPGKSLVCFRKCAAGCKAGDICSALASNDRFACVAEKPGLCQPCALNVDCPYPGDRCLELGGTKVCARDCSFDGQCPSSYRCADGTDTNGAFVTKQCQPTSGTCECTAASAGQSKPCSEMNAIGTCTGVQTCKPPNGYDACSAHVPTTESCNGRDDDCNGMTDENLGDTTCGTGECRRTVSNCINGSPQTCEPLMPRTEICDEKDNNCDGVIDEGFNKSSLANCGTCGNVCARANATPVCMTGTCTIGTCNPGFFNIDGLDSNGCEYACTPTGAEVCDGADNNCNGTVDEGFGLNSDPLNCGQCGLACNVSNGHIQTYACVASTCGIAACSTGFANCDQAYASGCEKNVSADVNNCGSCNNLCLVANGTPGCASSACTVASCNTGWGNCNNVVSDGCEQDTTNSTMYCGSCTNACPTRAFATSNCIASTCGFTCTPGHVDLDGLAPNGCEYACSAIGNDVPDYPMFVDANCDGVDGDASQSIFVALTGLDTNAGTRTSPKRTIGAAIVTADAAVPKKAVLIGQGTYAESVVLRSGVSLYGGYDPATSWSRATTNTTIIASTTAVGVLAKDLSVSTELQVLRITSANATGTEANGDGKSSFALQIVNSAAGVIVRGCDLRAGAGSAGASGTVGTTGGSGTVGGAAGAGGSNPAAAGSGGGSTCGGTGGNGGPGINGTNNGNTGIIGGTVVGSGAGGNPGSGGAAGSCSTTASSNGNPAPPVNASGGGGAVGLNAAAGPGTGLLNGTLGSYVPATGLVGGVGKPGGGGGGGGSGGGTSSGTNIICSNCVGIDSGGGGGGGGGGCGGIGGIGGRGGGGSFAISAAPGSGLIVEATTLTTASGGTGGTGGNGGAGGGGGPGGSGSVGGSRNSCTSRNGGAGAQGATGGAGGQGGGGSGGPGGPSVCILFSGTAPTMTGNNCTAGVGGSGGLGGFNGAQNATTGLPGTSTNQLQVP